MTDGEYNKQFSGDDSSKQAPMLCKAMRDAGITIYTVGFGFSTSASVPNPNVESMTDTERTTVGGTSIMGLMMLAAGIGTSVIIAASGRQAQEAVDALTELMSSKFGEEE